MKKVFRVRFDNAIDASGHGTIGGKGQRRGVDRWGDREGDGCGAYFVGGELASGRGDGQVCYKGRAVWGAVLEGVRLGHEEQAVLQKSSF
ncbi:hypothetical protein LIER_39680 [Lithospermum erythrorhizon]|uniref:Uncharacterized protein n=1 Tax=Lithospermum erythrorhizon TaxID=34254 RepID=A0AAV3QIF7_LITER